MLGAEANCCEMENPSSPLMEKAERSAFSSPISPALSLKEKKKRFSEASKELHDKLLWKKRTC